MFMHIKNTYVIKFSSIHLFINLFMMIIHLIYSNLYPLSIMILILIHLGDFNAYHYLNSLKISIHFVYFSFFPLIHPSIPHSFDAFHFLRRL